jgi:hypothetical protein
MPHALDPLRALCHARLWAFLALTACADAPAEHVARAGGPGDGSNAPGDTADDDTATDGQGDTGTGGQGDTAADTADVETAASWVRLVSPADNSTVANPVKFKVEGEGVTTLALSADGWPVASWAPDKDGWVVDYTFTGTGYPREILLEGFDKGGALVATDTGTITVESDGVNLDVPYFYQYDNRYEPGSTCGITSTAMALNWWLPSHTTPDELYEDYGKAQAQSPSGIAAIYRAEGLSSSYSTTGTRADIVAHLDAGRPVVVHGYWTSAGHIAVIVGYDDADWIVNDPAGDWYVCYGCGEADHVRYPRGGAWDAEMSVDGDVWYSVSDENPI